MAKNDHLHIPDSKYNLNPVSVLSSSVANIRVSSGLFVIRGGGIELPVNTITPGGLALVPNKIFCVSLTCVAVSQK